MRLAALFSGGKDSTYALYQAVKSGHEVKLLITMKPKATDSYMFHHPLIDLTRLQAESLGIRQIVKETPGEKERELADLIMVVSEMAEEIDGLVSGALASNYQKSRIDRICEELDLENLAPSWQRDPVELLEEEIKNGFEIIITSVSADGLDESWLDRKLDLPALEELKNICERFGINISAEGGEYETFVTDCPIFKKRIELSNIKKIWDEKTSSGYIMAKGRLMNKK